MVSGLLAKIKRIRAMTPGTRRARVTANWDKWGPGGFALAGGLASPAGRDAALQSALPGSSGGWAMQPPEQVGKGRSRRAV